MKTRLAMVALQAAGRGPWIRSRGNETGVRVRNLEEGSRIISQLEIAGVIQPPVVLTADGSWPLPGKWDRIHFVKQCVAEGCLPTHVDLLSE